MAPEKTPRRLGRGLDALLGKNTASTGKPVEIGTTEERDPPMLDLPVAAIRPNPRQPRQTFEPAQLAELRESIKATGLLQPVTVRKLPDGNTYELIAGERRFRAVSELGWTHIPALVKDFDDQMTLTMALVENLQRADLNPIEEAEGYARLANDFELSHQEIAELVGKDRSTIANLLRVLTLPDSVKQLLESSQLSIGHVRPLLALDDHTRIEQLAREAVLQQLSVRAVEERIRETVPAPTKPRRGRPRKPPERPAEVRHVEDLIRRRLQTDVSIHVSGKQRGELRVQFFSYEDLNRILDLIGAIDM